MSAAVVVQSLGEHELLARFVLWSNWIRSDQTLRPEAFIPHPYRDLSVSRHFGRTEQKIWEDGSVVALKINRQLIGRADFQVSSASNSNLRVESDPQPEMPHHALVLGWPAEKPAQKIKALEIAAAARYVRKVTSEAE